MTRSDDELKELKRIAESARAAWNAYCECQNALQEAFNIPDEDINKLETQAAYILGECTFEKMCEIVDA